MDIDEEEPLHLYHQTNSIDASNFIEINVINCEVKASSCGQCMEKQLIALGCGWCRVTSKCSMRKDCPVGINSEQKTNWMYELTGPNSYCSNPLVISMMPKCGPRLGAGTLVELTGQNLGFSARDIRVKMKPLPNSSISTNMIRNDLDCDVLEDFYLKATKILCKTRPLLDTPSSQFSVYVQTNVNYPLGLYSSLNQSNQFIFDFITPRVFSLEPRKGIKSGGTILKIIGENLSCGSDLKFLLDENNYCSIINATQSEVYCRTSALQSSLSSSMLKKTSGHQAYLKMKMDDYVLTMTDNKFMFEFVDDPKLFDIEPSETIRSGGLTMHVTGRDFDTLQTVHLIVSATPFFTSNVNGGGGGETFFKTECAILTSSNIECIIPQIRDKRMVIGGGGGETAGGPPLEYSIYIQFNEISNKFANRYPGDLQRIHVYPDPVFDEAQLFSDKTPIILIKGRFLIIILIIKM